MRGLRRSQFRADLFLLLAFDVPTMAWPPLLHSNLTNGHVIYRAHEDILRTLCSMALKHPDEVVNGVSRLETKFEIEFTSAVGLTALSSQGEAIHGGIGPAND